LTPHALNFSGVGLPGYGVPFEYALKQATALRIIRSDVPYNNMFPIPPNDPPPRIYSSDTSELYWDMDQKIAGYFIVNAPDVKVFTGFVRDREFEFGDIKMKPGKTVLDYATISLLSLEEGGYLLTATGTMHNTGGEPKPREKASPWEPDDMLTLENKWGDAPVLCEGVPLELTLPANTPNTSSAWLVYPLDEAGNRRAETPLRFENAPIRLGPEYKTLWYEIRPEVKMVK